MPAPLLIAAGLGAAADVFGSVLGSRSQSRANRANIKLQREQQAWEEMMSNTAVQRRKRDIMRAGGNPALAFTEGQSASTPTIAPAKVESTFKGENLNFTGKAMAAAQVANLRADTIEKLASAESKQVQARVDLASEKARTDFSINDFIERHEQSDLRTKIMRSLDIKTGQEAKRTEESVDAIIRQAKALAATQELTEKNLRRIVEMQGLQWKDIASIMLQLIKD